MAGGKPRGFRRKLDELTERIHLSPLGALVFLASVGVLATLHFSSFDQISAPAVGFAVATDHPAPVATVVQEVHVHPGDRVDEGAPLVTLSSRFLERELELIDTDIERLMKQARLEYAELLQADRDREHEIEADVVKARRDRLRARALGDRQQTLARAAEAQLQEVRQRVEAGISPLDELLQAQWVYESQRSGLHEADVLSQAEGEVVRRLEKSLDSADSLSLLSEPMQKAHKAELDLLLVRRRAALADIKALTVLAHTTGRVVSVLAPGAAVARDTSVASVLPDHATEVVAYVSPEKNLAQVALGSQVDLGRTCPGPSRVLRKGASVEQAPGQLSSLLGAPVYGTPLYITIPEGCVLGVGQVVSVKLNADGR